MKTRRGGLMAVSAIACAVGLSACGGFDSAASGEHLIKDYVKKYGQGKVSVKSVSCPSGVKEKVGATYNCKAVLHVAATGSDQSGTITIHIANGNNVEINGAQDLHFQ